MLSACKNTGKPPQASPRHGVALSLHSLPKVAASPPPHLLTLPGRSVWSHRACSPATAPWVLEHPRAFPLFQRGGPHAAPRGGRAVWAPGTPPSEGNRSAAGPSSIGLGEFEPLRVFLLG